MASRDPLPAQKRIHLVISHDPEALDLDDTWKRFLSSLAHDGLDQMRSHLLELEDRIPWNAVDNVVWEGVRFKWMDMVDCPGTASALSRALLQLEAVMLPHAFVPGWAEVRPRWLAEVQAASTAWRLREVLLVFEAHLRWLRFYAHDGVYAHVLLALLASPLLNALGRAKVIVKKQGKNQNPAVVLGSYQRALHALNRRIEVYAFDTAVEFTGAVVGALAGHGALGALRALLHHGLAAKGALALDRCNAHEAFRLIDLPLPLHLRHVAWLQGGQTERDGTPGSSDPISLRPLLSAASTAKQAAAIAKRAATRVASSRWAIRHAGEAGVALAKQPPAAHTRTLLVFEDDAADASLAGVLVLRPHTTLADVRIMLEGELHIASPHSLFRARKLQAADAPPSPPAPSPGGAAAAEAEAAPAPAQVEVEQPTHPPLLALQPLQDFKLAYSFFPHARDVLVARRRPRADISLPPHAEVLLRARGRERLLCLDVSCGLERNPIAVYNGVDAEPPPLLFSYVKQCVAVEAVSLLALYDADWPHPTGCGCRNACELGEGGVCQCVHRDGTDERFARAQPAYGPGQLLTRAFDSIYECHLLCACAHTCPNRVVQHGMRVRLEVFRTPRAGWGVRAVDAIRAGAFLCEYAGEYLPDDEAEERGIRYDEHDMSRLMDVQGDGPDALRMCVDATNFSNVARFVNHSCAPNCHKQRVFADHMSRLPRIALFALRDIAPLEEISYDYGYLGVPGKTLACHCGARSCKTKLY